MAIDSRNQTVRNSSGAAWKISSRPAKVSMSKADDSGPITPAKRIRARMFQTCGRAVASGRTVSKGMPISEKS